MLNKTNKCLLEEKSTRKAFHITKRGFCRSFVFPLSSTTLHKREKVEFSDGGCRFPAKINVFLLPIKGFCSNAISPYLKSQLTGKLLLKETETKLSSVEKKERILVKRKPENRLSLGGKRKTFSALVNKKRKNKILPGKTFPKKSQVGVIYLCCTTGNTICTLLDSKGQTKGFATCGSLGFTNSRKRTSYASQAVAEKIGLLSKELGFTTNLLIVKGVGRGKGSAIRAFRKNGIKILGIDQRTSLPHNGCRSCRKRRT